jgi:hypothetical protein
MRKLFIIPFFFFIVGLSYVGVWFVELNGDKIIVNLGNQHVTEPTPIGFVVLTSVLIGMTLSGFVCSIEMLSLLVQNRKLKRKLQSLIPKNTKRDGLSAVDQTEPLTPHTSGRFT